MKTKNAPKSVHELSPALIQAWRHIVQSPGPIDFLQTREFRLCVSKVLELQKSLKNHLPFNSFWKDNLLLGAYMAYFWPIHYQQARHLFLQKNQKPGHVWVMDAGAGAYTVAALECGASQVTAFESQDRCRMEVSKFVAKMAHTLSMYSWRFPAVPSAEAGNADTIILGHGLAIKDEANWSKPWVKWICALTQKLNPGGRLIIVESSDPAHKKALQTLKKELEAELNTTQLRDSGVIETLCFPLERTQLMHDIMRSTRRQELKSECEVWTLQRPGL
jgi:hypothetical protein